MISVTVLHITNLYNPFYIPRYERESVHTSDAVERVTKTMCKALLNFEA
jgi:hypothetical protein